MQGSVSVQKNISLPFICFCTHLTYSFTLQDTNSKILLLAFNMVGIFLLSVATFLPQGKLRSKYSNLLSKNIITYLVVSHVIVFRF